MRHEKSRQLYQEALDVIVGGVNSPSRSFKAVGGDYPIFMKRARGAYFWDEDDNRYIDYLGAFGPIILGHAHPHVTKAIQRAAENGVLYGTPTRLENQLARMLRDSIPSCEKIRFVNTGTEAVMSSIRVARAYTGRDKIVKFSGCYHGHADWVLVAAGSGPSTLGVPDSAGIPESIARDVITVPYNDLSAFKQALKQWGDDIAAVLVEPIVGNFGIVMPEDGFLESVNEWTRKAGALVIYDEVITAFRFHYGGAQNLLNVFPDLTALGKIIGGGLPIGAYGGRADIMDNVAPLGPVYQAGTMAGNPASMAAGIACLETLSHPETYEHLERLGAMLESGIRQAADNVPDIPVQINRLGGALTVYFSREPIREYGAVERSDSERFAQFHQLMLKQGIYLAPSKYEAWFLTLAHTEEDVNVTISAVEKAFQRMCR